MQRMAIVVSCTILILATTHSVSNSSSLEEIVTFTKEICDEINLEGNFSKKNIEAKLQGELNGIAKLIGGAIGAGGKIEVEGFNYSGLPYDKLPDQMQDSRQCKKDLATMLLNERTKILNKESTEIINVSGKWYGKWNDSKNHNIKGDMSLLIFQNNNALMADGKISNSVGKDMKGTIENNVVTLRWDTKVEHAVLKVVVNGQKMEGRVILNATIPGQEIPESYWEITLNQSDN